MPEAILRFMLVGHGYGFFARYGVERGFIQIQVSGDELGRCVREPFGRACQILLVGAL